MRLGHQSNSYHMHTGLGACEFAIRRPPVFVFAWAGGEMCIDKQLWKALIRFVETNLSDIV